MRGRLHVALSTFVTRRRLGVAGSSRIPASNSRATPTYGAPPTAAFVSRDRFPNLPIPFGLLERRPGPGRGGALAEASGSPRLKPKSGRSPYISAPGPSGSFARARGPCRSHHAGEPPAGFTEADSIEDPWCCQDSRTRFDVLRISRCGRRSARSVWQQCFGRSVRRAATTRTPRGAGPRGRHDHERDSRPGYHRANDRTLLAERRLFELLDAHAPWRRVALVPTLSAWQADSELPPPGGTRGGRRLSGCRRRSSACHGPRRRSWLLRSRRASSTCAGGEWPRFGRARDPRARRPGGPVRRRRSPWIRIRSLAPRQANSRETACDHVAHWDALDDPPVVPAHVVVGADLVYESTPAPGVAIQAVAWWRRRSRVVLADGGRPFFDSRGALAPGVLVHDVRGRRGRDDPDCPLRHARGGSSQVAARIREFALADETVVWVHSQGGSRRAKRRRSGPAEARCRAPWRLTRAAAAPPAGSSGWPGCRRTARTRRERRGGTRRRESPRRGAGG